MDANQAQEYAALMRQATDIVKPSDADEDQAHTEDFMRWAQERNLWASIGRQLDDDGCVEWTIEIQTGRGTLGAKMRGAGDWRRVVEDMGLV